MPTDPKFGVDIELKLKSAKFLADTKKVNKEWQKTTMDFAKKHPDVMDKSFVKVRDSISETVKAQKKANKDFIDGEKQKQNELKKTTQEIDKQTKTIIKLKDKGIGGFLRGLGGGMGIAGLFKKTTGRDIGAVLGRGISRGIGGLVGFITQGASSAYQVYAQYALAQAGLAGMGTPADLRRGLRGARGVGGPRLGFGPTETVLQAAGVGRATGNIGAIYGAQQFARGYGMDVGEVAGYMGMIRQAGFGFGGRTREGFVDNRGKRELAKTIEAGMISGLEKARLPEFLQGVSTITQQVGSQIAGVVNVKGISAFQALLASTRQPGLMGARGAAIGAQLGQAILRPGGGEAGQMMVLQALGFGKPGGTRGYYEALKTQQMGMQRPETVVDIFREVYRQLGVEGKGGTPEAQQEANIALNEMLGVSLDYVEKIGDVLNSNRSSEEKLKEIEKLMEETQDPQKQALKVMKEGFAGMAKHVAGVEATQIAIGAKFAPIFEDIQKLQLAALKWIADQLPAIQKWLKDTYVLITNLGSKLVKSIEPDWLKNWEQEQQKTTEMLEKQNKEMFAPKTAAGVLRWYGKAEQKLSVEAAKAEKTARKYAPIEPVVSPTGVISFDFSKSDEGQQAALRRAKYLRTEAKRLGAMGASYRKAFKDIGLSPMSELLPGPEQQKFLGMTMQTHFGGKPVDPKVLEKQRKLAIGETIEGIPEKVTKKRIEDAARDLKNLSDGVKKATKAAGDFADNLSERIGNAIGDAREKKTVSKKGSTNPNP